MCVIVSDLNFLGAHRTPVGPQVRVTVPDAARAFRIAGRRGAGKNSHPGVKHPLGSKGPPPQLCIQP